jgi:metallo-beta-lactamase class B
MQPRPERPLFGPLFFKPLLFAGAVLLASAGLTAQAQYPEPNVTNPDRITAYPPVRIVGSLYYVGTRDLASYLIATDVGHILINSGYASSVPMIRDNVENLGFDFEDIEIISTAHAHNDHVGGLGEIKRLTGAETHMHEGDLPILVSGGDDDYRYPGGRGALFEPIEVDHVLQDGDTIELGGSVLTVHLHAGHTKGAISFSFTVEEAGTSYDVLIANMGTVNDSVNLTYMPGYPEIVDDYERTFAAQKAMSPDIWVASHAGQFDMHDKYQPGMEYSPNNFLDPDGWHRKVAEYEAAFRERIISDADKPRD